MSGLLQSEDTYIVCLLSPSSMHASVVPNTTSSIATLWKQVMFMNPLEHGLVPILHCVHALQITQVIVLRTYNLSKLYSLFTP